MAVNKFLFEETAYVEEYHKAKAVPIHIYRRVLNAISIFQPGYISKLVPGPDSYGDTSSCFDIQGEGMS